MTTKQRDTAVQGQIDIGRRLPDIPRRNGDEVTQFHHLFYGGDSHFLLQHLYSQGADPATTLMMADHWIIERRGTFRQRARYPDLMVTFGADLQMYHDHNGYIIDEQGKPPDFVLEVASESTGQEDVEDKYADYEHFGIPEYWRFDEDGTSHGTKLAGDRLVDGRYRPLPVTEMSDGSLEGFSAVLNMVLRWKDGKLFWVDPVTRLPVATFEDERARANQEAARAVAERARADQEQARADEEHARAEDERRRAAEEQARAEAERERADRAEAQLKALEDELRRLQGQ